MKSLKNKIALLLYKLILFLVKVFPAKKTNNCVLLIKNDEIGDYILFRNFLKDIRTSEKYKSYKVILLGNIIWKQLFDEFDKISVDNVIWMQKKKFQKDLFYRFLFLKMIRSYGFSEVVNCIYSRSILNDDCFVSIVRCNSKVGMANNSKELIRTEHLYTQLITVGDNTQFDIYRNETFIGKLINKKKTELHTSVFFEPLKIKSSVRNYCVIFTGAGKPEKLWPAKYFVDIMNYIYDQYKLDIYLCGGPGDVKDNNTVKELLKIPVQDYTGKTTMPESLAILNDALFMLSVDTGSVHMGAGVKCPVIALYSGRDYGRFAPYPRHVFGEFYSIFSDNVDEVVKKNMTELSDPNKFSFKEISNIPPKKVIPYIDMIIQKNM